MYIYIYNMLNINKHRQETNTVGQNERISLLVADKSGPQNMNTVDPTLNQGFCRVCYVWLIMVNNGYNNG